MIKVVFDIQTLISSDQLLVSGKSFLLMLASCFEVRCSLRGGCVLFFKPASDVPKIPPECRCSSPNVTPHQVRHGRDASCICSLPSNLFFASLY